MPKVPLHVHREPDPLEKERLVKKASDCLRETSQMARDMELHDAWASMVQLEAAVYTLIRILPVSEAAQLMTDLYNETLQDYIQQSESEDEIGDN